ncbi:uncharacterized protein MYCGRDRAFT_47547 [Zymoseptoria tritici IPO323]|uniref:DNA polymerase delta subunit 4 n=1 Tax=Zymoseptoria tritici (strain CBS 115943 / IPO323) TaxID=336722 RepID=F9XJM5_ZYMTI|nr:uncharacterized protein MYCGRDRAFT_47547 [Zymoseptoria tritici IPO323]EGP84458.1 hypothetical protein MYCGRDRAFT_47547 [Zymoseptoria tritici IPO323]
MPPKRRSNTPRTTQRQQGTLSFHGKSKVTKPTSPRGAKSKKDPEQYEQLLEKDIKPEVEEPTTAEKAITEQVKAEVATLEDPLDTTISKTEDESEARKVSATQINKYWRAKEAERKAPRVHQQDLSTHEKILREWDMSGNYGPCIGIARLKRWKRANMLGLNPPIEVLAVLLKELDGGEVKSQRAHVDELMSSRFIET